MPLLARLMQAKSTSTLIANVHVIFQFCLPLHCSILVEAFAHGEHFDEDTGNYIPRIFSDDVHHDGPIAIKEAAGEQYHQSTPK